MSDSEGQSVNKKLGEMLWKVDSSKRDIEAAVDSKIACLSEEFAQTTREFQKFKKERNYGWKREGNRQQFDFNSEVIEQLATILWGLRYSKTDYADELAEALMEKLNTRNKHTK